MKSILYAGAFLMIGAGIYGFVDYKKTSSKAEFAKMYDSNDDSIVVIEKSKNIIPVVEIITDKKITVENKSKITKKKGALKYPAFFSNTNTNSLSVTDSLLRNVLTNENPDAGKEKKVLSYKLFSRAPLERKYINKELKLDTVNKQQ